MIVKIHLNALLTSLMILWIGQGCSGAAFDQSAQTSPTVSATVFPSLASIPSQTQQLDLSQMAVSEWASTSFDGRWVAAGLVGFPKENAGAQLAYVRLIIFDRDGRTHWTIIDNWEEIGLGFPMPEPLKWSRDSRYFYFTHRVTPDGCSAFPFLVDLQQVNLEDGKVNQLLPQSAMALALSPNESRVAYISSGEKGLVLKDLVTGQERETKIDPGKEFDVGNILWSPDGRSLALTLAINPCSGTYGLSKTVWAESTTLLWVDEKTLKQKILVKEDPRLFIAIEWNEPQRITITDGEENSLWSLDVNTGEITRE